VANIRHQGERSAAERLVADVGRLRKEKELFNDVLGFRGSRTAITAVVANLADPDDPRAKEGARQNAPCVAVEVRLAGGSSGGKGGYVPFRDVWKWDVSATRGQEA
jgi:hypothetical protein